MEMFDLRRLDIFQSPSVDVAEPSVTGGALTLSALFFCVLCFFAELGDFREGKTKELVFLEGQPGGHDHVTVYMNITLFELGCKEVSLDIQDRHGRFDIDQYSQSEFHKTSTPAGGCNFEGNIYVRHMQGNFHFTPRGQHLNNKTITHAIHALRFGDHMTWEFEDAPMSTDSLDHEEKSGSEGKTHDYLVKLVRTEVVDEDDGEILHPFQYTFTHRDFVAHHKGKPLPPRIFFRLQFSPLTMKFMVHHMDTWVFLTRHMAIFGGTFAILKMFYSGAHVAHDTIKGGKFM